MTASPADTRPLEPDTALLCMLGLCPLLAAGNSVTVALALCIVAVCTAAPAAAVFAFVGRRLPPELRMPVLLILIAGLVSAATLVLQAWRPRLDVPLDLALPLIASIALLLSPRDRDQARAMHKAGPRRAIPAALGLVLTVLVLAGLREFIGHGSIGAGFDRLLGAGALAPGFELFDARRGFLLALLPPGGLILLGLMLAVRKAWRTRRTPPAASAAA